MELRTRDLVSNNRIHTEQRRAEGKSMKASRIQYIDGMRGIAILGVVLFHAYTRWGSVEPYEQADILVRLFSYGWLGVQLFFAISGYVIYMSVLRSSNILMFASARYLRLAPAMYLAAVLLFVSSYLIPERPLGPANPIDLLPSLTFIDPVFISSLTGLEPRSLDGAFWSIYVGVNFYAIVALAFFLFKDRQLNILLVLYAVWILTAFCAYFQIESDPIQKAHWILNQVGVNYYGWFLLGVYTYRFETEKSRQTVIGMGVMATLAVFTTSIGDVYTTFAAGAIAALFLLPLVSDKLREILSSSVFVFFGFISYPLYLIHQNIVTGLAIKLFKLEPGLPAFVYPIPFLALVIGGAYLIAKSEPWMRKKFRTVMPQNLFGYELVRR